MRPMSSQCSKVLHRQQTAQLPLPLPKRTSSLGFHTTFTPPSIFSSNLTASSISPFKSTADCSFLAFPSASFLSSFPFSSSNLSSTGMDFHLHFGHGQTRPKPNPEKSVRFSIRSHRSRSRGLTGWWRFRKPWLKVTLSLVKRSGQCTKAISRTAESHGLFHFFGSFCASFLGTGNFLGQDLHLVELNVKSLVHVAEIPVGRLKALPYSRSVAKFCSWHPTECCTSYEDCSSFRPIWAVIPKCVLSVERTFRRQNLVCNFDRHFPTPLWSFPYISIRASTCHLQTVILWPSAIRPRMCSASAPPPAMAHDPGSIRQSGIMHGSPQVSTRTIRENHPTANCAIGFSRHQVKPRSMDTSIIQMSKNQTTQSLKTQEPPSATLPCTSSNHKPHSDSALSASPTMTLPSRHPLTAVHQYSTSSSAAEPPCPHPHALHSLPTTLASPTNHQQDSRTSLSPANTESGGDTAQ